LSRDFDPINKHCAFKLPRALKHVTPTRLVAIPDFLSSLGGLVQRNCL